MNLFGKQKPDHVNRGRQQLSGDSSVGEWLEHAAGGAIVREMLADAGYGEGVLKPVRRLALRRLITMSGGRFTEEMLANMVRRANAGGSPAAASPPANEPREGAPSQPAPATWQEKITPGRFVGKTVIVTGAGSGIGRATASRIAREGGRVIAVDISQEGLERLAASLPEADITPVVGDITADESIERIMKAAGKTIDGLANVAGITDNMTPLHEVSNEVWNRVMAVNLLGMMKLSRAVLPAMLARQRGSIVNVGSEASLRGSVSGVAYTASKHAVVGLSKSGAFMYGPSGIRVNVVAPGPVDTGITRDGSVKFDSDLGADRIGTAVSAMPEMAAPEALAASITFLLSDDGVNVNGAILPSDGGWSAQ